ncbi:MAG: thiol reductant ABC exporter subunit CydC [Spirochaetia bacterium]|jgi:ATP-binding cassette subfamily C protein CydC
MKLALRLASLLLPSWRMALLGILVSLFALAANLSLLALSSWFITSMALAGAAGAFMDYTTPAAAVRALALARAGGRYAERLVNHDTTLRILSTIRVWFFRRIEPLAPARLQEHRSGDLLGRIRADVDTLDDFYVRGVVPSVVAVLALGLIAAFLVRFDPRIAAIDGAALAASGLLLPIFLKRFSRVPGSERAALTSDLRASVVEHAQGMAELIALEAVHVREQEMTLKSRQLELRERRLASLQGAGDAALIAASSLAAWAGALVLAPRVAAGTLPGAEMAMITVFILATFEAVMPLPPVIQRAGELAAAARRLFDLIDAAPAVDEPQSPAAAMVCAAGESLGLVMRGLRFRYDPDGPWVIDGLSMEVPAGGRVGVSGPSGVGKSTLVNLLLRFWDYEQGSIIVAGAGRQVELRSIRSEEARRLFSVVPQSPFFFHASIRENLSLALPEGSEGGEGAIRAALETAQLTKMVAALPDGLETTVGERGLELSAGEARRLAVARALLKEAAVYVLDEPTEGLDERTADALMDALDVRLRAKTLIVISHRERDMRFMHTVVRLGN